jgi:hypothetical protein
VQPLSMSLSKNCIKTYEGRKNTLPLHERFSNAHHGFMKDFKNAHLLFV